MIKHGGKRLDRTERADEKDEENFTRMHGYVMKEKYVLFLLFLRAL